MAGDTMKVGELAERTGLSVRTLHHYDEIGLLTPAARTPSGHRIYGTEEVHRLQRIASLRHLGLTLDEIRACLEESGLSFDRVLEMQMERLRERIDRQRRLIDLLGKLRQRLTAGETVTVDEVALTIRETIRHEKYYSPEQREALARRAERVGADRIRQAQEEWTELFEAFGDAMARGLDPASAEVGQLADRALALIEGFTGGDPGIRESLSRMYREEGADNITASYGVHLPEGLWGYYGRALVARRSTDRKETPR